MGDAQRLPRVHLVGVPEQRRFASKIVGIGWRHRRAPARSWSACPPASRCKSGPPAPAGPPAAGRPPGRPPGRSRPAARPFRASPGCPSCPQRHPLPVDLDAELPDREAHLLDQPPEGRRLLRVRTRWRRRGLGALRRGVSPPRAVGRRPSRTRSRPSIAPFTGSGSSIAPSCERTVASVPATPWTVQIARHEAIICGITARQGADSCLSPGSLPLGAACSISALISPPIRMKRPVTYIQVSNTITAPMLP